MRSDSFRCAVLQISLLGLMVSSSAAASEPMLHHQEHPESSPILASYDFEAPTPSGPDTHWIRQRDGGGVALSDAFRVHGERSLHVSEVPGNRDFAEFLAYFRERDEGLVFVQFYLLLTDPEQSFNFGLAGPGWFLSTGEDGHAVWLQTDQGLFRHRRADGWEELFEPRPFAWYFIDLVYDVDRGTYALRIHEEGLEEPLVDLRRVPSMNGHPGSSVKYFSLIGDLEDEGRFDFFVDDLLIATHPEVVQKPFVAPGRRSFFVETLAMAPRRQLSKTEREDLFWQARRWLDALSGPSDSIALDRLEAAADEAFLSGHLDLAGEIYRRLGTYGDRDARILLKLADVAHLEGDVETERRLRESLYGRLDYEAD
ncbi:MAG: hypothetical protein R3244_12700 [Thermoanaerobaculia bacterium]|nr:hypothetical protein [Thermoanaerobaculia bacterium]